MHSIYTSLHLLLTLCWHWLCSIIVHLTFNRPPTCCQKSINLWLCHDTSIKAAFTIFVSVMPHKPTKKLAKMIWIFCFVIVLVLLPLYKRWEPFGLPTRSFALKKWNTLTLLSLSFFLIANFLGYIYVK